MTNKKRLAHLGALVALLSLPVQAAEISGAGSSAAAPLYSSWAGDWTKKSGVALQYAAVGSSAGVSAIRGGKTDFGTSDVPLSPSNLERDGLVNFPTAISGVVPIVNIPGVAHGELKLDGATLADILAGRVTRWNAASVAKLNRDLHLPDLAIRVIAREDGSGSTYVLSHFLAQVSPQWAKEMPIDFRLKWPEGAQLVSGTSAMLDMVAKTAGAIGYAEFGPAEKMQASMVRVGNQRGEFVRPGPDSFRLALKASEWTSSGHFEQMLTNMPDKGAWPITSGTFVIMRKSAANPARIAQTLSMFSYGLMHGDAATSQSRWIPLPELTQARVMKEMAKIRDKDGQPIAFAMSF